MVNPLPLLIVMGTILTLLGVQRILTRMPPPAPKSHLTSPSSPPKRTRGRPLDNNNSATGLDERAIEQLKQHMTEEDIAGLTIFLAFNRPGFVELDHAIKELKTESTLNASTTEASTEAKAESPDNPHHRYIHSLTESVRQRLFTFDPKSPRLITRELMSRFGGHDFNSHFMHYAAKERGTTHHVPPFDPERHIMEALSRSGIALKGRHIPLPLRLTVLKMSQLRQMAKDLNLNKKFTRKQDAVTVLADVPGSAVLLSMQYVVDDLFVLNDIDEDCDNIKNEWAYLTAYSKLLNMVKLQ